MTAPVTGPLPLPHPELARRWRAARPAPAVRHLDVAACARASSAVLRAMAGHAERESTRGGYVAEVEAAPVLDGARIALAALLADPRTDPAGAAYDVAFVDSATTAFALLLAAWPLPAGARVGIVRSEYGPNRAALAARAERDGLELVELPSDPAGRVDLAGLRAELTRGLALVTLPHVPSQRGVVQPARAIGAACAAAGTPLLLDVAQSLGQVDCTGIGAAAYVGTSRKWLCGPRGVGFLALRPAVAEQLAAAPPHRLPAAHPGGAGMVASPARRFETAESSVAARVGLAVALGDLAPDLPAALERVAALGQRARRALADVPGWRVVEPAEEASGIVTLEPAGPAGDGVDVAAVHLALLERGVLVSAVPVTRAADLTGPVLRASFAAWCEEEDVSVLAELLGDGRALLAAPGG